LHQRIASRFSLAAVRRDVVAGFEQVVAGEVGEGGLHLGAGEDGGQVLGFFGADEGQRPVRFNLQHFAIEEEEGAEGQMGEAGVDLNRAEGHWLS